MSRCNTIIAAALAVAALAAPAAFAQPQDLRNPDNRAVEAALAQEHYYGSYGSAGEPAQDLRSPDARDAAQGRGTFSVPDIAVVKLPQPAPVAEEGTDWGDVGIGAGGALGLALLAFGGTFAVVHRRQATRPMATTG